ncbi:MAG: HAD family hydrolase [Deltaproteobacteria bacterium]|nr:HAD family hydrolase [Deltaproteobacteria bacterium]
MKACRAVLFDLDGTLLYTLQDLADSMNAALGSLGYPARPVEDYRFFVGQGVAELARRALPENSRDQETIEAASNAFMEEYAKAWNRSTMPYGGVEALLDALQKSRLSMAVLSNKPQDFTEKCVQEYFPQTPFAEVRGTRPGVPRKPDPAGALAIARDMGVAPASFAYVGDSGTDVKTALAAGMRPVGALWGYRPRSELEGAGAVEFIQEPLDLLPLLGL